MSWETALAVGYSSLALVSAYISFNIKPVDEIGGIQTGFLKKLRSFRVGSLKILFFYGAIFNMALASGALTQIGVGTVQGAAFENLGLGALRLHTFLIYFGAILMVLDILYVGLDRFFSTQKAFKKAGN